jgi:hypothetical protein
MSSADIDALAWQPTVRCRLGFDYLDVVVAADGTPYASLVDAPVRKNLQVGRLRCLGRHA